MKNSIGRVAIPWAVVWKPLKLRQVRKLVRAEAKPLLLRQPQHETPTRLEVGLTAALLRLRDERLDQRDGVDVSLLACYKVNTRRLSSGIDHLDCTASRAPDADLRPLAEKIASEALDITQQVVAAEDGLYDELAEIFRPHAGVPTEFLIDNREQT